MATTKSLIDLKFLSVCPAPDAVQWLRDRRAQHRLSNLKFSTFGKRQEEEEKALAARNDPYIDFGLARFGIEQKACKEVYERGDLGIRCTFLASFPNGGFDWDEFGLASQPTFNADELCALATNETLKDNLFEDLFSRDGPFSTLSENNYLDVLAAWNLTEIAPATPTWAHVLQQLLAKCQPPVNFDPIPVFARWYLKQGNGDDRDDPGFYLRQRLADLLQPNDVLLNASDSALRASFYQRFEPSKYPRWSNFIEKDGELFLDAALLNRLVWKMSEDREILSRLCWNFPNPRHMMDMPNRYRAFEARMQTEHPEWFENV